MRTIGQGDSEDETRGELEGYHMPMGARLEDRESHSILFVPPMAGGVILAVLVN